MERNQWFFAVVQGENEAHLHLMRCREADEPEVGKRPPRGSDWGEHDSCALDTKRFTIVELLDPHECAFLDALDRLGAASALTIPWPIIANVSQMVARSFEHGASYARGISKHSKVKS
ncbi:MAG: hypothetical protein AAB490_04325 [Patescibacteria group bacterium]